MNRIDKNKGAFRPNVMNSLISGVKSLRESLVEDFEYSQSYCGP